MIQDHVQLSMRALPIVPPVHIVDGDDDDNDNGDDDDNEDEVTRRIVIVIAWYSGWQNIARPVRVKIHNHYRCVQE